MSFTETDLFRRTLGQGDSQRQRLVHALDRLRERAAMLAGEIHRDLPDFTVHDITHIDALWEMADLIAGPDYPLTPLEAFALGGVFLLHDLGLGLAAWPGGPSEIKQGNGWKDTLSAHLRKHLDRVPTEEELASPPPEIERAAIQERLRVLHAERAEDLATVSFQDPRGGATYHLIEDDDLRHTLGPLLGKIAHSHWWPVSRLGNEFGTVMGALPHCPRDWTLDPLKVAVLLRTADAAHLDARRAPGFLRALRRPEAFSREHWLFQEHLLKPRREEDRLVYTTSRPFPLEESDAWWLCLETLQMVDRELHEVDALLADLSRPRLKMRGVAGVENPRRLTTYVKISGWSPVDARVHVSNVADLVRRLGGEQLYGNEPYVPLRELIQNAADAIRARRLLQGWPADWGRITVRLGRDDQGPWIEVEDTGIGMSETVLSGPLLDFGSTYWGSALMREEHEGLWAKGFEPAGRYGIGFFSVFMCGRHVSVTTRPYQGGQSDTRILEFTTGLLARPRVRQAGAEEQLREGGTRVRVWLEKEPTAKGGMQWARHGTRDLDVLSAWLAPALDVDLYVESDGNSSRVVAANDWLVIDPLDLIVRAGADRALIASHFLHKADDDEERGNKFPSIVRTIVDAQGRALGRGAICPYDLYSGAFIEGGLRAGRLDSIAGVLVGSSTSAVRNKALVVAEPYVLGKWASEQALLLAEHIEDWPVDWWMTCTTSVIGFGGHPGPLPLVVHEGNPLSFGSISSWKSAPSEVIICARELGDDPFAADDIRYFSHVVTAHWSAEVTIFEGRGDAGSLLHWVVLGLTNAWGCPPDEVEVLKSQLYRVGKRRRKEVWQPAVMIRRLDPI